MTAVADEDHGRKVAVGELVLGDKHLQVAQGGALQHGGPGLREGAGSVRQHGSQMLLLDTPTSQMPVSHHPTSMLNSGAHGSMPDKQTRCRP